MITDISYITGNNPGGNLSLIFAPLYDITAIPVPVNFKMPAPVTFAPGLTWRKFDVMFDKLSYEETEDYGDNGPAWQISIKGFTRGDSPERKANLFKMVKAADQFIVICKDNAQALRMVGTSAERMSFNYKLATGDSMAALRAYAFEFSVVLSTPPPFL